MCPEVSILLLFVFYHCYNFVPAPEFAWFFRRGVRRRVATQYQSYHQSVCTLCVVHMPCTYGMYSLFDRSLRSPSLDLLAGGACAGKSAYFCFSSSTIVTLLYQLLSLPSLRFHTYGMYSLFARSLRSPPVDFLAGGACARKSAYSCFLSSTIVMILYQLLS